MRYAISDQDRRILATKGGTGRCPGCLDDLIPKCGDIKVHHWAHKVNHCDDWHEPETDWHLEWKSQFPEFTQECWVEKNGKKHVADVILPGQLVMEFQHSPIPPWQIREREEFYGKNMIWVLDASEFRHNLELRNREDYFSFRWKHPRKSWFFSNRQIVFDFGFDKMFIVGKIHGQVPCGGWGRKISKPDFIKQLANYSLKEIEKWDAITLFEIDRTQKMTLKAV